MNGYKKFPYKAKSSIGCAACKHNEAGICILSNKEIGVAYILRRMQGVLGWCKLNKEKKNGKSKTTKRTTKKTTGK